VVPTTMGASQHLLVSGELKAVGTNLSQYTEINSITPGNSLCPLLASIDGSNAPSRLAFTSGKTKTGEHSPIRQYRWRLSTGLAVNFDTTSHREITVGFWVVVWMERPGGGLV